MAARYRIGPGRVKIWHQAVLRRTHATAYLGDMDFTERILDAVRRIPAGRVASYGGIAAMAGKPRAARQVGRALRTLPDGHDVPWWRVISARGEISIPRSGLARPLQRALLEEDGVAFDAAGRVDMRRFGWPEGERA